MSSFGRASGFAVVAVLSMAIVVAPSSVSDASATCSTTSTFDHAGSPYDEGSVGLTSASGNCIVIDASAGPVVFEFAPTAAVTLERGGSIETVNTSAANSVTFGPESGQDSWGGIVQLPATNVLSGPARLLQLTNTTVVGAGVVAETDDLSLSETTVDGAVCDDYSDMDAGATATIDALTVTTATGCGPQGPAVLVGSGAAGTLTMTNSTVTVTDPTIAGVTLRASGSFSAANSSEPPTSAVDLVAHGNVINGVKTGAALTVSGLMTDDPLTGVGANSGANDVDPLTAYGNAGVFGDLSWSATPAESPLAEPFGVDGSLVDFHGNVTVSSGAEVGDLAVFDGAISAPVGPTDFYGSLTAKTVTLDDADVTGKITIAAGTSDPPSTITNSSVFGAVILTTQNASGTPLTVTGSAIGGGINAIAPDGGKVLVTGSRLSGSTTWGLQTDGRAALSCDVVSGNFGGVLAGNGSTITASDLEKNTGPSSTTAFDFKSTADASSPVTAGGNYWGQPGGPVSGQVSGPADTSSPLDTPPLCATHDPALPQSAGQFQATPGDQSVTLTWTNPTDPTFTGNVVRMFPAPGIPDTSRDGIQIYAGTDTSATIGSLKIGQIYSFVIFSSESDALQPGIADTNGASRLPLPVTGLTATPGIGSATLSWTPSADPGTTTVVCASEYAGPPTPSTCTPVYSGADNHATVASATGQTTYYAWSKDSAGSFSAVPPTIDVYFARVNALFVGAEGAPSPTKGQEFEIGGSESGQGVTQQAVTAQLYSGTLGGTHHLLQSIRASTLAFDFKLRVKVATSYFVLTMPTSTLTGAVSAPVTAVPQRWIHLTTPKAVEHGRTRTIGGRVLPHAGLSRVSVYVESIPGAPGALIGHATVNPTGRFFFVVKTTKKGSYRYYAQTGKSMQYAISSSNIGVLTVT
ncbi:MAG TPA: hypothetical protein VHW74_17310 [Mycobacteriales bacterium]|nr:hypothetical protein [Mycobacteriales bacterium]